MDCPTCESLNSHVIDTRMDTDKNAIRRRRRCDDCGERYNTYEVRGDRIEFGESNEEAPRHAAGGAVRCLDCDRG